MWELSLEERDEKETWERTRWTWKNAGCNSCKKEAMGERTDYLVRDMGHLPCIVTDHTAGRIGADSLQHQGDTRQGDGACRTKNVCKAKDDLKDSFYVAAYSSLDTSG